MKFVKITLLKISWIFFPPKIKKTLTNFFLNEFKKKTKVILINSSLKKLDGLKKNEELPKTILAKHIENFRYQHA